jgi:hypothetical protein
LVLALCAVEVGAVTLVAAKVRCVACDNIHIMSKALPIVLLLLLLLLLLLGPPGWQDD